MPSIREISDELIVVDTVVEIDDDRRTAFAEKWGVPHRTSSLAGGPIMALGIHQIDLLLTLLGDWEEISAQIARRSRDIETDDVATAWVRFADGTLVTIANSAVSPAQESHLRIDAEKATVKLTRLYGYDNDDWRYTPAPAFRRPRRPRGGTGFRTNGARTPPQLWTLVADVLAGRRPQASGDDGRKALELVTALYKSALTGQIVRRGSIGDGDPFYTALNGGISF